MRPINKIIIHCSATPEGRDVDVEDVRDWHMKATVGLMLDTIISLN